MEGDAERKVGEFRARARELVGRMTLQEKASLCSGRDFWSTKPIERLGIPSITLADGPHGLRKATGADVAESAPATCFPTASALASSWDADLLCEIGQAIGREAQASGVHVLLGPAVNLKRSPLCGRNFEYFSEDPRLAGELAAAFIEGVQSEGVGTSLKHFAANNQEFERMTSDSIVDERTLREIYLAAFELAVRRAQPWTVMCAYNKVNGTFASESAFLLHDVLKREWAFQGFVVSDWGAVNDRVAGVRAGLHLEMPSSLGKNDERIVRAIEAGELPEARLDAIVIDLLSVILQAKASEHARPCDFEAHHALARRAAAESTVLLANDGLLPLVPGSVRRLAVIGEFAERPRYQGAGSSQVRPWRLTNARAALEAQLSLGTELSYATGYTPEGETTPERLAEATRVARAADVAVVFVGLPDSYESEAFDRTSMALPAGHDELVEAVLRVQPRTVVVSMNGAAVSMPWADRVPAIVEAWLGGQAGGEGLADVLTGRVNPCGKLSETFPLRLEDTPAYLDFPGQMGEARYGERVFVGYRYYDTRGVRPRFRFGHGLSYTTFAYSDLALESRPASDGNVTVHVCAKVTNTGQRAGKEIVQLYVHEQNSRVRRPHKELKRFCKVALEPGEAKVVEFVLEVRDFAYFDIRARDFVVDAGRFSIGVGGSSEEPELVQSLELPGFRRSYPPLDRQAMLKDFVGHPRGEHLVSELVETLLPAFVEGSAEGAAADPAKRKARNMAVAFLYELPLWKLPAMSQGRFSDADLEAILARVR